MRPELIIGIDAGASGGIAWQYAGGMAAVEAMPPTEGEVVDLLRDLALDRSVDRGRDPHGLHRKGRGVSLPDVRHRAAGCSILAATTGY